MKTEMTYQIGRLVKKAVLLCVLGFFATGTAIGPAAAQDWHHDGGGHRERGWDHREYREHERWEHRHYYVPPPVYVVPPPRAIYAPPPVMMVPAPGISVVVPLVIR
jgi:hypothetical protein